jgi:hypothetical protein
MTEQTRLSSEEAHAINRLMDPPPKTNPLRRYVPLYWTAKAGRHLGMRAFATQTDAWTRPRGPNIPPDLKVLDVIAVRVDGEQAPGKEG